MPSNITFDHACLLWSRFSWRRVLILEDFQLNGWIAGHQSLANMLFASLSPTITYLALQRCGLQQLPSTLPRSLPSVSGVIVCSLHVHSCPCCRLFSIAVWVSAIDVFEKVGMRNTSSNINMHHDIQQGLSLAQRDIVCGRHVT